MAAARRNPIARELAGDAHTRQTLRAPSPLAGVQATNREPRGRGRDAIPTQPSMPRAPADAEQTAARSPSGVRARRRRPAILEVDATPRCRDPRREDDDS